MFPHKY